MSEQSSPLLVRPLPYRRRVLLVDDEWSMLATLLPWLEDAGWTVTCARSVEEALRVARGLVFAAAVVDYRLDTGGDGLDLGRILNMELGIPFLLVSGFLDTSVVVNAMKSGALDVMDKPLARERLLSALKRAIAGDPARDQEPLASKRLVETAPVEFGAVTARWARMVLGACDARDDPRTVPLWGHAIGASAGTIEATCRLCDVKAHDARDLGRVLRALSRSRDGRILCRSHFAVADDRTLRSLFERAGLDWSVSAVPLRTFFLRQRFVEPSKPCLHELAHLAANSGLF